MPFKDELLILVEIVTQTSPSELLLALNQWRQRSLITDSQINFQVVARENLAQEGINLEINASAEMSDLLEGLRIWQERDLLNGAQIRVEVQVNASHPSLLEGLEEWLQLGFLSESKIKQLCQENLSCVLTPLPYSVTAAPTPRPIIIKNAIPTKSSPKIIPERPKSPSKLRQMLQSLMAELSVLWLLLLGVFMIVVSSGVIAASLWEKFPAAGQYSVLWLYTLVFWGASFWASQKPNLRLTRMALRLVTLLLVPMNFVAIDSLGLWRNPLNWLIIVPAALSLTAIMVQLFRGKYEVNRPNRFSRSLITHLGLSYLHWGWGISGFPLWATYLGVVGTALINVSRPPEIDGELEQPKTERLAPFSLNGAIAVYALAILLVRAIFIAQVEITQLGLALGICGWLASRQARSSVAVWERIGGSLLLLGWLLSVVAVPWQALAVSGLGIGFCTRRLLRSWLQFDLAALLLIGLQGLWLLWRLIPVAITQGAIAWGTRLTGSEDTPWALLSLVLFPYLISILVLKDWFSRLGKRQLAALAGKIALLFGTILTVLSLVNPALRTLNFAASTVVLGTLTLRQVKRANRQLSASEYVPSIPLAHFTHIAGLITLASGIDWALPKLSLGIWAIILLLLMALELFLSKRYQVSSSSLLHLLGNSAWNLGLILGGLAYGLLLLNQGAVLANSTFLFDRPVIALEWCLVWGIAPVALTGVGTGNLTQRQVASWLSVVALVIWQWLTLAPLLLHWLGQGISANFAIASLSLSMAAALMLVNTRNLQQLVAAAITIGLGLSWVALSLWVGSFGWALRQEASWLLAGAIASTSLWIFRHRLRGSSSPLGAIYAQALDGWATFLCSVTLFRLLDNEVTSASALATWLLMGATAYRSGQSSGNPNSVIGVKDSRGITHPQLPGGEPGRGELGEGFETNNQNHPANIQRSVIWLSIAVLLLGQIPTWGGVETRLTSLGIASGLMFFQTRRLQQLEAAAISVGLALGLVAALIAIWPLSILAWLLVGAIAIIALWSLRQWLSQSNPETGVASSSDGEDSRGAGSRGQGRYLAMLYARACDGWAITLCSVELVALTFHSLVVYWNWISASSLSILVSALILGAIAYRSWPSPSNWGIYGIGWSLELLTIQILDVTEYSLIALAIANTVLGLITQLAGDWWHRHAGKPEMLSSWNILPLFYGALGAALRWGVFSSWTGLITLGFMLIAIGVGRRSQGLKPLLYLSIAGISISAYELLCYQIANLPRGDQLLAMAALAASFVYGYRLLSPGLTNYLRLTPAELKWVAHLHWALGSCLLVGAVFHPVEVHKLLGLGAGIFLTRYAIFQGRNHPNQTRAEIWVYLGILEAAAIGVYIGSIIPDNTLFIRYLAPWLGAIASLGAVAGYLLPWQLWGWPPRPWQVVALILPLLGIGGYLEKVNEVSLLMVAGFYAWLARIRQQPRWYYLTLLLVNWAIVRWLAQFQSSIPFAYSSLVGVSLICCAWIEPTCRGREGKPLRHYLRLLGTGIIGGAALWLHHQTGILPGIVSLVAIFAGLALRIRAFLYIGTLTFLADAFYHLVILIFDYPLLKWVVGLLVGLSLLSIAGSFETRRAQLTALLQNWLTELQEWD